MNTPRSDADREVWMGDDDDIIVPAQTTDAAIDPAERYETGNDSRLREERPPHW